MGISRSLGVGACSKVCRLRVFKQGIIFAICQPLALLILLDPQRDEHSVSPVQSGSFLLPRHRIALVIGDEGRDRRVERLDDTDVVTVIQGPDVGSHPIRTLMTVKGVNPGNDEVCVIVEDHVVVRSFEKREGGHGIIPCWLRPALPEFFVVGDDFQFKSSFLPICAPFIVTCPSSHSAERRPELLKPRIFITRFVNSVACGLKSVASLHAPQNVNSYGPARLRVDWRLKLSVANEEPSSAVPRNE
jgi:hypothetical protein